MKSKQKSLTTLFLGIIFIVCNTSLVLSQEVMKIQKKDNTVLTIPTSEIVNITFEASSLPTTGNTVTDVDGNVYNTVKIGYQVWMAENLRTTKYNDGTPIPNVIDKEAWGNSETGKYCSYNNSTNFKDIFGPLYNWHTVKTDKLCPSGWHVSTDDDWKLLGSDLGGLPGIQLKEAGTAHWKSNTNATNETGFTALPGGLRYPSGGFSQFAGELGAWWTSSPILGEKKAFGILMYGSKNRLEKSNSEMSSGLSVRCVKD